MRRDIFVRLIEQYEPALRRLASGYEEGEMSKSEEQAYGSADHRPHADEEDDLV